MTFFQLVRCAVGYGFPPSLQNPLPIIGMKHALPTVALQFLLGETRGGAPLRVAEIQRPVGWTTPDLLRNCVYDTPQVVFTSPQVPFCSLTLGNFLFQRFVG